MIDAIERLQNRILVVNRFDLLAVRFHLEEAVAVRNEKLMKVVENVFGEAPHGVFNHRR